MLNCFHLLLIDICLDGHWVRKAGPTMGQKHKPGTVRNEIIKGQKLQKSYLTGRSFEPKLGGHNPKFVSSDGNKSRLGYRRISWQTGHLSHNPTFVSSEGQLQLDIMFVRFALQISFVRV